MKKMLLPLLFAVLGLGLGAGGVLGAATATGVLPVGPGKPTATAAEGKAPADHGAERPTTGFLLPTRERIVNLADAGAMRYLKTTIVLELVDPAGKLTVPKSGEEYKKKQEELTKELKGPLTLMDDQITNILSSKTVAELMSPEGKQRLRDELRERLQRVLPEYRIVGVYFTDFIIQ
ncbi:MAG TPA: flagellar basal body-associated FliL family protein [Chloroflexota bacterium]|jgi:flagellar FliL protein|nr:flagellar basal body-associated FliL family protein [Chloroflexota bacterium]